jgi:hypothetical protein
MAGSKLSAEAGDKGLSAVHKSLSHRPEFLGRVAAGYTPNNVAAIDVGATMHMAAVRADPAPEPVRSFGSFTTDLHGDQRE